MKAYKVILNSFELIAMPILWQLNYQILDTRIKAIHVIWCSLNDIRQSNCIAISHSRILSYSITYFLIAYSIAANSQLVFTCLLYIVIAIKQLRIDNAIQLQFDERLTAPRAIGPRPKVPPLQFFYNF